MAARQDRGHPERHFSVNKPPILGSANWGSKLTQMRNNIGGVILFLFKLFFKSNHLKKYVFTWFQDKKPFHPGYLSAQFCLQPPTKGTGNHPLLFYFVMCPPECCQHVQVNMESEFYFSLLFCSHGMRNFPDQGLNLHHGSDPSRNSENSGSLTTRRPMRDSCSSLLKPKENKIKTANRFFSTAKMCLHFPQDN